MVDRKLVMVVVAFRITLTVIIIIGPVAPVAAGTAARMVVTEVPVVEEVVVHILQAQEEQGVVQQ